MFTKIDRDLSGDAKRSVFLWYTRGEGRRMITSIELKKASPETRARRIAVYEKDGHELLFQKDFEMEILVKRELMRKIAAPTVDKILISSSFEEAVKLEEEGYEMINPGLAVFGLDVASAVWVKRKGNGNMPNLLTEAREQFQNQKWFSHETESLIEKYAISPQALETCELIFRQIDRGRAGVISVTGLCRYLGEPHHQVLDWLFEAVGCTDLKGITFMTFLTFTFTYCLWTRAEILRFLFKLASGDTDTAHAGTETFITKDQLHQLMDDLTRHEGLPMNKKRYREAFDRYAVALVSLDNAPPQVLKLHEYEARAERAALRAGPRSAPADGLFAARAPPRLVGEPRLYIEQFCEILESFPALLYPVLRLQTRLAARCLGEDYWNKHRDLFQLGRAEAGVRLKYKTGPR